MEHLNLKVASEATKDPAETVVLHVGYPLWRKHTLVAIARAKELQENGARVILTYCNARSGTCAVNFSGSPIACAICHSRIRETAHSNGLTAVPLKTPGDSDTLLLSEKKDLAEGVHSAVISTFRQLPGDGPGNPVVRAIKRRYFQTAVGLLSSMKALLKQEAPDRVEVFNGRHACSRFCITAAVNASIPFNTMEITSTGRHILFRGHTAHDRIRMQKRMLSLPLDIETARKYFERCRRPSTNKYARKHSATFVPPDASGFRKKVSVFLSSQDEFEALGPDWKSPFPDYAAVVRQACVANPDYLFCVRFHPNQADIASDIETPFEDIRRLPNAVIYYPRDTANSYTLADWSDVVVTFGSRMTIEACWIGKPSIMLGPSFWDQLDVSYNPSTMPEFLKLLRQDLAPRPAENAARFPVFKERDCDLMQYVGHNGTTMVPSGVVLERSWLSRIARTSDNVFCRIVKSYSRWSARRRSKSA